MFTAIIKSKAFWVAFAAILLCVAFQRGLYSAMDDRCAFCADSDRYSVGMDWHFDAIAQPTALLRIPLLLPMYPEHGWGWGYYGGQKRSLSARELLSGEAPVYMVAQYPKGARPSLSSSAWALMVAIDFAYLFAISALAAWVWQKRGRGARVAVAAVLVFVFVPWSFIYGFLRALSSIPFR